MNLHKCQTSKDEHGKPLGFAEMAAKKRILGKISLCRQMEVIKKTERECAALSVFFFAALYVKNMGENRFIYHHRNVPFSLASFGLRRG